MENNNRVRRNYFSAFIPLPKNQYLWNIITKFIHGRGNNNTYDNGHKHTDAIRGIDINLVNRLYKKPRTFEKRKFDYQELT